MAEVKMPTADDFPNKSDAARRKAEKEPPAKQIAKVTKGKVTQRKKPIGKRFAEAFGAQEGQGVMDYILYDIVVPAVKNMLLDSIADGAEMALFGEVRSRRRRSNGGGGSRYQYDKVSYRNDRDDRYSRSRRDRFDDRQDARPRANIRDYEDIVFGSKADAEEVISGMIDTIEMYDQVTIADLYDMAGVTPEYTYGNYGWTNLSTATVVRNRDGYVLNLPRPIAL